jgi:hypothetical protein
MEKGDVRMYDEKKRNGRGAERRGESLCILGVWEGARMKERVLDIICIC